MMIGISGNSRTGKDTLFRLLNKIDPIFKRFALADSLKYELVDFIFDQYGISSFTENNDEKKLIRPILLEHGRIKRIQSNGKYWTSKVDIDLNCYGINSGFIPVVTDIRYCEFKQDELWWLKEKHKGCLVYIKTYNTALEDYAQPANEDERVNNIKLEAAADFIINWNYSSDEGYLMEKAKEFHYWYENIWKTLNLAPPADSVAVKLK